MENGSITNKDVVGWLVAVAISLIGSLVPLLIFYLEYQNNKKQSSKKILELEEMLYKQEIKTLKQEITLKEEIIVRKDLEIQELKKKLEEKKG